MKILNIGQKVSINNGDQNTFEGVIASFPFLVTDAGGCVAVRLDKGFWNAERTAFTSVMIAHLDAVTAL
jgi:hypothetical protein